MFGLVFLVIGVFLFFAPMARGEETPGRVGATVIAIGSLAVVAIAPARDLAQVAAVQLDGQGLSWTRHGRTESRWWDEVREVHRAEMHVLRPGEPPSDRDRRSRLRVIFNDGSEVSFNHMLSHYDQLAERVRTLSAEHLFATAWEATQASGLTLGPAPADCDPAKSDHHDQQFIRMGVLVSEHPGARAGRRDLTSGIIILLFLLAIGGLMIAVSRPSQRVSGGLLVGTLAAGVGVFVGNALGDPRRKRRFTI